MKIAIIGAGWTGSHLARVLLARGVDLTIYESSNKVFAGASGTNQGRLHQGFHFPRSSNTINELAYTFQKFKETYKKFITPIETNIYAIAADDSLINFNDYRNTFSKHTISFQEIDCNQSRLIGSGLEECVIQDVSGAVLTEEMLINNQLAADYFSNLLEDFIVYNVQIPISERICQGKLFGRQYDFIIDCSYGKLRSRITTPKIYQACAFFRYYSKQQLSFALTIMDGAYCSLYPSYLTDLKNKGEITLSGVEESVLMTTTDHHKALEFIKNSPAKNIKKQRQLLEEKISRYYPNFHKQFTYMTTHLALKTKDLDDQDAERVASVTLDGKLIEAFAPKMQSIMVIEEKISSLLGINLNCEQPIPSLEIHNVNQDIVSAAR